MNSRKDGVTPQIQFLCFDGCPLVDAARQVLEQALVICGLQRDEYELIDILDPATPQQLAGWGSPTILVNGLDVSGHDPGEGVSCRVYNTPGQVPTVETIAKAITDGRTG